jgi:hypothetical protein
MSFFCIFPKVELPIAMFIFCTKGSANYAANRALVLPDFGTWKTNER